jgi:WD40 repeat protein
VKFGPHDSITVACTHYFSFIRARSLRSISDAASSPGVFQFIATGFESTEVDEHAGILVTGGHDQDVVVTDVSDGAEKLRLHGGSGYIKDVIVFSSDQAGAPWKYVAWSTLDGAIRVSRIDGGQQAIALGHSGRINRMLAARNDELVSCSDDGTVRFWAIPKIFRSYAAMDDHVEKVSCIASTDATVWSAGYDGWVMARDVRSGDLLGRAQAVDEPLHTLVPFNGSQCLIGTESGLAFTAEIRGSPPELALSQVTQLGGWISAMRPVTPRGLIALGTGAGELALYDCRQGLIVSVVELHAGAIRSLEASRNGRYLYTGGEDGRIVRFDLDESAPAGMVAAHDDWVHKMLMHESMGLLLSISDDATLRAFDPLSLERRSPVLHHDGWLADVLLRPDGRVVFTVGQDGNIYAWDAATFELLSRTPAHSAWISGAALAVGGRALVTVAQDQAIRVWSTYELSRLGTITIDTGANVNCLNVIGQRTLVVGGVNGKVFLVRLDDNS